MEEFQKQEYFDAYVKGWAQTIKQGLVENLNELTNKDKDKQVSKNRKTPKLSKSISIGFKRMYGTISEVSFRFARHGLFIHYGVGRGYIREGNSVRPGRRYAGDEIGALLNRGYTRKEISKMRHYYSKENEPRKPIDWFDVEIRKGMKHLVDYACDLYLDKAMYAIKEQMEKPLPLFTQYVKVRQKK